MIDFITKLDTNLDRYKEPDVEQGLKDATDRIRTGVAKTAENFKNQLMHYMQANNIPHMALTLHVNAELNVWQHWATVPLDVMKTADAIERGESQAVN